MGCGIAGGLDQTWCVAPARFRRQACRCPLHAGVLSARLVPGMCRSLPPQGEGSMLGLIQLFLLTWRDSVSLLIGCAVDPTIPRKSLYMSFGVLISLATIDM